MSTTQATPPMHDPSPQELPAHTMPSFQLKSTLVSLMAITSIALFYAAHLWGMIENGAIAAASEPLPPGFGGLVLTTLILIILVEALLQAVLAFGAGAVPRSTAHDRERATWAQRNGYGVLLAAVFAAFSSLFWNPSLFVMGNLLLLGVVLSEITKRLSIVVYRRRR